MQREIDGDEVAALVDEYLALEKSKKSVDQLIKDCAEKIKTVMGADDPAGDYHLEYKNFSISVKPVEVWEWDCERLTESGLPCIKQSASISRKDFDALSRDDKKKVIDALTVKQRKPSIKITKEK